MIKKQFPLIKELYQERPKSQAMNFWGALFKPKSE